MKMLFSAIVMLSALSVTAQGTPPRTPALPATTAKAKAAADEQLSASQQQLQSAQDELQAQLAQVEEQAQEAAEQAAQAAAIAATPVPQGDIPTPLAPMAPMAVHRSHGAVKSLVVRSGEAEPKDQPHLEEDLAVMSRILDKALEEKAGRQTGGHRAMGINVVFGASGAPFRNLYLEGYGAVFLLQVNFPLVAPPKPETKKENATTSSDWEEARQELYGQPASRTKHMGGTTEPYDEDKVNELKDGLLGALKNAGNIQDLKPDDSITLCVFGAGGGSAHSGHAGARGTTLNANQGQVWVIDDGRASSRGTVMTIRVRKSDADAFAKDKLSLDEFRKKAKIATYLGNGNGDGAGGVGWGSFNGTGFQYDFSR